MLDGGGVHLVTDHQSYYQLTADTNSIAWLVWHLSRWRGWSNSKVSGDTEVWISEGRNQTGRHAGTGGRFPARTEPGIIICRGCASGDSRPGIKAHCGPLAGQVEGLAGIIGDSTEHVGQINYLRGMTSSPKWR